MIPECKRKEGHCWHASNVSLTVDPPLQGEVCCWCGVERWLRYSSNIDMTRHGEFFPRIFLSPR